MGAILCQAPAETSSVHARMRYSSSLSPMRWRSYSARRAEIRVLASISVGFSAGWRGGEYETLLKQVAGERTLQPEAIEAMASALHVTPEYFLEYRRHQIEVYLGPS